jgi:hypothetical protein
MPIRARLGTGCARGAEQAALDTHVGDGGAGRARRTPRRDQAFAAILPWAKPMSEAAGTLPRGGAKIIDLDAAVFA